MTSPVDLVAVRTVAIVQEVLVHETLGRPGARDECQLAGLLVWNVFGPLIVIIIDCVIATEMRRWHMNDVFCGRRG